MKYLLKNGKVEGDFVEEELMSVPANLKVLFFPITLPKIKNTVSGFNDSIFYGRLRELEWSYHHIGSENWNGFLLRSNSNEEKHI